MNKENAIHNYLKSGVTLGMLIIVIPLLMTILFMVLVGSFISIMATWSYMALGISLANPSYILNGIIFGSISALLVFVLHKAGRFIYFFVTGKRS